MTATVSKISTTPMNFDGVRNSLRAIKAELNALAKEIDDGRATVLLGTAGASTDGSAGAPSLSWKNDTNTGLYRVGADSIGLSSAGVLQSRWVTSALSYNSQIQIGWSSSSTAPTFATHDINLLRDAAGALAMRNGTNGQELRWYGTYTSATSYQRSSIKQAKSTLSAVSGATATAANLIPDGAFLIGVTTRINTGLGAGNGTTGYAVGTAADPNLWGDVAAITAGTASKSTDFTATGASGLYIAAESVILTAAGGNFDGTGEIEVIAHYLITEAD